MSIYSSCVYYFNATRVSFNTLFVINIQINQNVLRSSSYKFFHNSEADDASTGFWRKAVTGRLTYCRNLLLKNASPEYWEC